MFARTPRLTLRPGWPEDAPALATAIGHEAVATRLAHVPFPYTAADAEAWLATPQPAGDCALLILAHDQGPAPVLVGGIGLHAGDDGLEIGYWLTPTAWGRGYATEAGRQMLAIARHALGRRHVTAWPHADDPASARVLHKLGFREVSRAPRPARARGGEVDSLFFTLDLEEDRPAMPLAA